MKSILRKLPHLLSIVLASLMILIPYIHAENVEAAPEFTSEEKDYISSHKSIRIGYVKDRVPISFTDENGEFAGISRFIFDRVSELCGIEFEYVPLPEGDVTYDYLIGQKLDLVSSVEFNEENKHARGILISMPYLTSRKVVVGREDLDFSYDAHLTIAVQTGSQTIQKVLSETYPNFDIVEYDTIIECLDSVKSGRSDLMIQNQYVIEYLISKPTYEKLEVIPVLGLDDMQCFSAIYSFDGRPGQTAEDGAVLIGILDKAIASLTEDETGSYTIKSISEYKYSYTFSDFLYKYRMAAAITAAAAIIILILTVLIARQHVRIVEDRANDKVKGRFLSTMSHEIRTPLNGLIGLNRLMTQNIDDREHMRSYLSQSTVTAQYLLSLVNDMLDMSSIQSHDMHLDKHPLDLALLLNTVDSIASDSMREKNLRYTFDSNINYPCIVGDAARIQQVIFNLLDNARKFTPRGGMVKMFVEQKTLGNGRIQSSVVVSDTGRGMSEEFQKHIFDTFAQELDTVSKGNQGTGLGLPICRRLAQLMDGDITFVSKQNDGSTFTFTFESEPAEASDLDPEERPAAGNNRPRILVAEDNELNGEIIMELLQEDGFDATLTVNGKDALAEFSSSAPGTYGVILMDLLMPEMDGYAATSAIRALDRPDAETVRIFACTANCSPDDEKRAISCGMNDFITKPIDIDVLIKKISE